MDGLVGVSMWRGTRTEIGMSNDPLLQPYQLKHLTFRNRIMTTSHEPAYAEDGMPKERYAAYHAERAKAGVALAMTAGSASVSRDSPPVFNNILAYKDEVVPWMRNLTDACHEHGCAVMIQLTHHSVPDATSSSVLGPFHVSNPPPLAIGGDMKRDYEGEVLLVEGHVRDQQGNAIAGAEIDIWQTAPNGMYSSQDPDQDIGSFHALMKADENGRYAFTTVRPVSYTVPSDGPVGKILDAAGRHPWRPSHLHFIVSADGFRSLVTEVFPDDDPYLDEDTVFGVRDDLVMTYVSQPAGTFPEGFDLSGKVPDTYSRVEFDFVLATG